MTKAGTHKQLNWDDCEHLLSLLAVLASSQSAEKEKP